TCSSGPARRRRSPPTASSSAAMRRPAWCGTARRAPRDCGCPPAGAAWSPAPPAGTNSTSPPDSTSPPERAPFHQPAMAIRWTDATPALRLPALPDGAAPPGGAPDVWIAPEVEATVLAHLRAHDVEQGGLLVGDAFA